MTDEELLALLRQCSVGLLARIIRLCTSILRPRRVEIYCQLPCANPECPNACGRRVDPTRQRQSCLPCLSPLRVIPGPCASFGLQAFIRPGPYPVGDLPVPSPLRLRFRAGFLLSTDCSRSENILHVMFCRATCPCMHGVVLCPILVLPFLSAAISASAPAGRLSLLPTE